MSQFLDKTQIAALSMKQLENRVFIFESSPADEKYFRTALARRIAARSDEDYVEFRQFLWDITFERNDGGATIKYLHFNERSQRVYLDWYFVEWANRASDEIEATLENMEPKNNCGGWQTHPGTNCGHFYPPGADVSLCRRERRNDGELIAECQYKCSICEKRISQPINGNLFA